MNEKIPSGHSSPAGTIKTDSSSSRESETSIHFDFHSYNPSEPLNCKERNRRSSWDESDDDLLPEFEGNPEPTQLHSSDSQKFKASVAAEINELKKQFFESLQKLRNANYEPSENATNILEMKSEDRRQCPARVRRRTKSSSSLSPVLEAKSHSSSEKLSGFDQVLDEVSSKILDFDSKYYLNNFFNELRMKRISLTDPFLKKDKAEEEEPEWKNQKKESIPSCNDLASLDSNENDEHFCKTSRKLSQIIEVEESRKDSEKSSEETFSKSLNKLEENTFPVQTARIRNEKISQNVEEIKKENFKSLSFEEFGDFQQSQKPFQGSLSERSSKVLRNKPRENFSFLSIKSSKPRPTIPKLFEDKKNKSSNKFVSFDNQLETDRCFSQESGSKEDEKEKLDLIDCLKIDLMKKSTSENPTPRSTDRSEFSYTTRTKSGKSRNSDLGSPKFKVNIDRDSARSLRMEDVNTPDSLKKITETETESEPKAISYEDSTPKKSQKNLRGSEFNFDKKFNKNLHIPLESSSLESVKSMSSGSKEPEMNSSKSQKSISTVRSRREKDRMKKNSPCLEVNEQMVCYSLLKNTKSYERPPNSRVGSPILENYKSQSQRSPKISSLKSSRSLKSERTKTPNPAKKRFSGHSLDQEIPVAELDLPLDISESQKSSYRSAKAAESKSSGRSDINTFKHRSRRTSDRSSSSKSKNTESIRTPKITQRSNDSISSRSKESLENPNEPENPDFETWRKLEKINHAFSNRTSGGISNGKGCWRKTKTSSQPNSPRKKISDFEVNDSDIPQNTDTIEERCSASARGKSSRRSMESTHSSSPTKLIKFSPNSEISEECNTINLKPNTEKLYLEIANEIISSKIPSILEDENVKETFSTETLKIENESDRYAEKRLSIINEASFEDLEIGNDTNENEESSREQSRRSSRKKQREFPSQNIDHSSKNTGRNQKRTPKKEPSQEQSNVAGSEKWNELIETFGENPNSFLFLENTFFSFPYKTGTVFDSLKENTCTSSDSKENQKSSAMATENKYEIPERYLGFESEMEEKEEDSKNPDLEYEERPLKKSIKKDLQSLQNFQNLYYFNVSDRGSFGIGECGDVANWNVDKSDSPEKPKGYGDGTPLQKTSEVLAFLGKREKEVKIQRHLWTDLKGDFRNSKQTLQKLFMELENHTSSEQVIPIELKASKSNNCITAKNDKGNDSEISTTFELKNKTKSQPKNLEVKIPTTKNTTECDLNAESPEHEKEDIECIEFECETPRRSRSMIDLSTRLEKEKFEDVELNTNFDSSGSQLFERANATSEREKESTNLNIFLARNQKEEKEAAKSNSWLNFKTLEMEQSHKKGKKIKKRKAASSPKYLCTGKSRMSVPPLKLRNQNCFQNFYKRIISVFCLTSHSSAATSK